jgi:hypothetical protein
LEETKQKFTALADVEKSDPVKKEVAGTIAAIHFSINRIMIEVELLALWYCSIKASTVIRSYSYDTGAQSNQRIT